MPVTASGVYVQTQMKVFDATQLAVAPLADAVLVAMFTNSITPNFSTDTGYGAAPYNANEVSGTGYTAGGATLGTKTFSELNASQVTLNGAATSWAASTISNARCALVYDNTLAGKNALCLVNFGADYSTTAGPFTITWNAAGIYYVKCY